jgi:endonuclease/exonuclease/phosphatase family metal-dependent hydrolase
MKKALLLVGAAWLLTRGCSTATAPLKIATFNIERFGADEKHTDLRRLTALVAEISPDVLAVQEIEDPARFSRFVERLGGDGRHYRLALSECGGGAGMRVGFVYDADRVRLDGVAEYPELDPRREGACTRGERPGLVGRFGFGDQRFALVAVHLMAYADEEFAMKRRNQWRRAFELTDGLRAAGWPVAILGDTNSTGWLNDRHGERTFIRDEARRHNLRVITDNLECSEYFVKDERLQPSMLDHVVASADFPARRAATVNGFCARLECRGVAVRDAPSDFWQVSDHCPVSVSR